MKNGEKNELLHWAGGMQIYLRKNGWLFARSFITFAIGLLSCLNARTASFTAGKAPTTMISKFNFYI